MPTSPQRRRRILHAHELRQAGKSLRQIAETLGVSHATIHADLKLFETDWSDIAEQTADDFLFEHVTLLRRRVHRLLQEDPTKPLEAFSFVTDGGRVTPLVERTAPAQIARLHEVHHRAIATALREYRLILRELRPAAKARALADAEADAFDFPDDQLVDAPRPKALPDPAKTQPKLNEPNHLRPAGPPDFDPSPTPEQRERQTLSMMDDYKRSKTNPTNPDQPQPPRPDTQPLETATAKTPPDTPTTEPTKPVPRHPKPTPNSKPACTPSSTSSNKPPSNATPTRSNRLSPEADLQRVGPRGDTGVTRDHETQQLGRPFGDPQ